METVTRETLEQFIENASEENRESLRRMQWKIDQDLNRYKDPVARMNRMVELLWEGVDDLYTALSEPSKLVEDKPKCKVVELKRKNN